MLNDSLIKKDVLEQFHDDPTLNASEIGVSVKNGVVTLSGIVDTYLKKIAVEKAVERVPGVKAVAEDIRVGVSPPNQKTDTEIAEAVVNALERHSGVPHQKIKIKVEEAIVYLEGEVQWDYQRENATKAIMYLPGVRAIHNCITTLINN